MTTPIPAPPPSPERLGTHRDAGAAGARGRTGRAGGVGTPSAGPAGIGFTGQGGGQALLLVGHGSRLADGTVEMRSLASLVTARLAGVDVDLGFLEMSDPPAGAVLDRLAARGARRIAVVPLMLLAAGHAKSDVPAVVALGRARHPDVDIRFGRPLGVSRDAIAMLGAAVIDAGGHGLPLLVIARGTSDPDANGDAHKAARLVAEWSDAPFVHTGFTGVTRPLVPDALDVFARLGHERIAVAFWFLCTGRLLERARRDITAFEEHSDVRVIDAGYLGADPRLVPLIVDRYRDALAGTPSPNCDACSYRAPWPGITERVGQAIGVGHSHLAVEHRGDQGERG